MKEGPILFNGPMVSALQRVENPKTQTRRVVKPQPPVGDERHCWYSAPVYGWTDQDCPSANWHTVKCPYGYIGDRLWVRETYEAFGRWETRFSEKKKCDEWHFVDMTIECGFEYRYEPTVKRGRRVAGAAPTWHVRPSIFMPRTASRITLEVIGVRVERLQDISAADARAEGIEFQEHRIAGDVCRSWKAYGSANGWYPEGVDSAPVFSYRSLWDSLNAARGYGWDINPWVWVVEFRKVES